MASQGDSEDDAAHGKMLPKFLPLVQGWDQAWPGMNSSLGMGFPLSSSICLAFAGKQSENAGESQGEVKPQPKAALTRLFWQRPFPPSRFLPTDFIYFT